MRQRPSQRGIDLLAAHLCIANPDAPTARERLDLAVGAELAALLVGALRPPAPRAGTSRLMSESVST